MYMTPYQVFCLSIYFCKTAGCLDIDKMSRNGKFYRVKVLKDFIPSTGVFQGFSYGANSITGWRLSQEDRHICLPFPQFTETWSFFGIYDGHGGEEVAEYLKRKLHHHVLENFKEYGDIKSGLSEGFKHCDRSLRALNEEEFTEIKDSITKEFSCDDYKPSTSNSAASISDALVVEVKKQMLKHMGEVQADLNELLLTKSIQENKAEGGKKEEKRLVTRSSSKKLEGTSAASSSLFNVEKSEDEKIPLVGLSCGSTATVVVFTDYIIYVANVGDSRCIASVNGTVKKLSRDHHPLNTKEKKRILESEHKIIRGRIDGGLNMSRAFGDFALKNKPKLRETLQAVNVEPSLCAIESNSDLDFIVIASDGIWNSMGNEAVRDFVACNIHLPLPEICEKLIEDVLKRSTFKQGQDNMSMIIIKNDKKYEEMEKSKNVVEIDPEKTKRLKK